MKLIPIALAANDAFSQHLGCTLASILLSSRETETFSFFILDGGISPENKAKIESLKSITNNFQSDGISKHFLGEEILVTS